MRRAAIDEQQALHARTYLDAWMAGMGMNAPEAARYLLISDTALRGIGHAPREVTRLPTILAMQRIARGIGCTFEELCGPPASQEPPPNDTYLDLNLFFDERIQKAVLGPLDDFIRTNEKRWAEQQALNEAIVDELRARGVAVRRTE